MIDIEFIVQYLVLANAHEYPALTRNTGNVALLNAAAALGLIGKDEAQACADAYRLYRRLTHALQLQGQKSLAPVESVRAERDAVKALWKKLLG
jgi:glutamate-ammonia-ligase adenylyltransferase